jgi:hypothetical protein
VILLENSNEWNLFPAKRRILKKREEKEREKKLHMKKLHVSKGEKKKKEDDIYKLLGEILSKERKKERRSFSYSAKSDEWPHSYSHIICI